MKTSTVTCRIYIRLMRCKFNANTTNCKHSKWLENDRLRRNLIQFDGNNVSKLMLTVCASETIAKQLRNNGESRYDMYFKRRGCERRQSWPGLV